VTFNGQYYRTRQAKLYTRPEQAVPLYVSSMAPRSARFAGRHGDGLITVGGEEPDIYRQMLQEFEMGAREAGKDPTRMPRLIELGVAYTDDHSGAITCRQQYWAGAMVPALFAHKIYTPAMSAKNGKVVGADTLKQKACISADPEEHRRFAQQYVDLGFTHLFFHSAGPDQRAFLERYGRDVLPRLRGEQRAAA
jgi:coenzyme F420-dependent glucose-6-phosphate dehydrogenase